MTIIDVSGVYISNSYLFKLENLNPKSIVFNIRIDKRAKTINGKPITFVFRLKKIKWDKNCPKCNQCLLSPNYRVKSRLKWGVYDEIDVKVRRSTKYNPENKRYNDFDTYLKENILWVCKKCNYKLITDTES